MGGLSIWHWMIVLAVGLLLFGGRGKVSDLMGDVAKGIKSFKKGLADDDESADKSDASMKSIETKPAAAEMVRRSEADTKVERSLS